VEKRIAEAYPVVMSLETESGGKPGVPLEVSRELAAKLIKNGSARLATEAEARAFRQANAESQREARKLATADRVHVTVLTSADLDRLKDPEAAKEERG
jgi:hypothetical protein